MLTRFPNFKFIPNLIFSIFFSKFTEQVPYINLPLHTLLIVRSHGYNFTVETVPLKVECVDTYRVQPKVFINFHKLRFQLIETFTQKLIK